MTDPDDLPVYPLPFGALLRGEWFPLHYRRLLTSRFAATVSPAAGFHAVILWAASAEQDPAGTLPDDDVELARLAGLGRDVEAWRALRAEGALYGWSSVICEGEGREEVRLGHATISRVMSDAMRRIEDRREASEKGAERSLRSRLRTVMRRAGAHAGLIEREDVCEAVLADLRARAERWSVANVREALERVSVRMDREEMRNVAALDERRGASR